ncbi:zinc finger protein 2 homolog [Varanus komodoensis]|nr:zinc finger protein 2 homolog [Varanus komodoensis]
MKESKRYFLGNCEFQRGLLNHCEAGDRWLSENEEQKPFAESPEKMEQLLVLLKTDRGKAILGQREADENRHTQSSHVVTHESTVKKEKSYKCWQCSQNFSNIADLLTHERTHIAADQWLSKNEEQKPFTESPEKTEQLRVLQKTDKGKAILHQGEADENRHGQSSHVVTHESTVREEKTYKCWHCGQSFSSSTDLLTHERTHVGEKMYKCPHCGERERMRMGQKLNKCSHCGNTLGWNPRGRIHVVQKPYTSSEFRKEYMQISDFLNHQRIHEQKNPYKCSKCGANFDTYLGLKAHRRTHTSESQYKCSHCGMCFNWSSHLRLHERIHTAVCSYCGKSFSQKSELVEHEKTHAAEGSFACLTCGKTFPVSSELAAHVRTYAEKSLKCLVSGKSFQCSECGDSFNHNSALTVHQKIHTGKKS